MESCLVCGNDEFKVKRLLPGLSIRICTICGFIVSQVKKTKVVTAEFSRINESAYHQAVGGVRQLQAAEILSFVKAHGRDAKVWLDIGCSFGYLLSEARAAGYNVFGIEPDEKALSHARGVLGNEIVQQGFFGESTAPDGFDIVSMLDVLEHIKPRELPDLAQMIYRKLRNDGFWVIKVPTTDGLYFKLAHRLLPISRSISSPFIKRLWQSEYQYPHTVYFNESTIKLFLQNQGFELIATKYLQEVPNGMIVNRLLMDDTIPKWQALFSAPVFLLINLIEKARQKSDALLVLAKKVESALGPSDFSDGKFYRENYVRIKYWPFGG